MKKNRFSYKNWKDEGLSSKHFTGFKLYIIKCTCKDTNEQFYKIGKTFSSLERRFEYIGNVLPYDYEVIVLYTNTSIAISKLESRLLKENKTNKYKPMKKFNGDRECFSKLENSVELNYLLRRK